MFYYIITQSCVCVCVCVCNKITGSFNLSAVISFQSFITSKHSVYLQFFTRKLISVMWYFGFDRCILGEMFQQKPLFASRDDLHQLCLISSLCGSPNALVWPDVTQLPRYYIIKSREQHTRRLREEFYL